jgi:hypothetical protein
MGCTSSINQIEIEDSNSNHKVHKCKNVFTSLKELDKYFENVFSSIKELNDNDYTLITSNQEKWKIFQQKLDNLQEELIKLNNALILYILSERMEYISSLEDSSNHDVSECFEIWKIFRKKLNNIQDSLNQLNNKLISEL